MTGFVDRLVARGAGLPFSERSVTLRLRPVSSFEAGTTGPPLLAGWADPVTDDGPRASSNPISSYPGRPKQCEPVARRLDAADPSPPAFDAAEPAEEETIPPRQIQTESRNDPFDVSANRHRATREQAPAAERSTDPVVEAFPPVRPDFGDNLKIQARMKIQAQPVSEPRAFVEAVAYQHRDSIPDSTPSSAEITPETFTPGWREPPSFAMAETQAPVTAVTVGRIDVQFLQPPAPPAASPSAPRSSGFDAYARARRGIPR